MEWVDWFNNRRLHSVLDYWRCLKHEAGINPGAVQGPWLTNGDYRVALPCRYLSPREQMTSLSRI